MRLTVKQAHDILSRLVYGGFNSEQVEINEYGEVLVNHEDDEVSNCFMSVVDDGTVELGHYVTPFVRVQPDDESYEVFLTGSIWNEDTLKKVRQFTKENIKDA